MSPSKEHAFSGSEVTGTSMAKSCPTSQWSAQQPPRQEGQRSRQRQDTTGQT